MAVAYESGTEWDIHPLTPERWDDFAELFGKQGAVGGCWCMWFRRRASEYARSKREENRAAMQALVEEGREPGLLAYTQEGLPVGWVSLAPREQFVRLQLSRTLGPVDDQPVWSIVCFFIRRGYRGQGIAAALLRAAIRYAAERGARILEGYPSDPAPKGGRLHELSAYTGVIPMFEQAGFRQVARRRPGARPVMRLEIE